MKIVFVVVALFLSIKSLHKTVAQSQDLSGSEHTGTSNVEYIAKSSRRINHRRAHHAEHRIPGKNENTRHVHPKLQPLSTYSKPRVAYVALQTQYFIKSVNCENFMMTTKANCQKIRSTPLEDMIFYYAPAKTNTIYTVTYADGSLKEPVAPSEVAVVDPFPLSSFGHFVFVFYIYNMTNSTCRNNHGLPRESNICLTLATRRSCRRLSANATESEIIKKCEINFIPLVYDGHRDNIAKSQRLECVERVSEYADCPKVIDSEVDTASIPNTSLFQEMQQRSSDSGLREVCQEFGLCDYAVGIFGGWNNLTSQKIQIQHQDNAIAMFDMLKTNGFTTDKIQYFFHKQFPNELRQHPYSYQHGLPANNKQLIRGHIKNLCTPLNCVDSLVIYLNSPTTTDGSLLLWDTNGDGRAAKNEEYRVNEFLKDITGCNARQLVILADQSYGGILASSLRKKAGDSRAWSHVILLTSTEAKEYSWNKEATKLWGKLSPTNAIADLFPKDDKRLQSTFTITNRRAAELSTIYGASKSAVKNLARRSKSRSALRQLLQCQPVTDAEYFGFPSE